MRRAFGNIGERRSSFLPVALWALAYCGLPLHAQKVPPTWEVSRIRSSILEEDREIFIATPSGYKDSSERYPALYVLDAETNFRHASGTVEFLAFADRIPEMIVVGIPSGSRERRTRDLTPETTSAMDQRFTPGSGGAAKFLSFLTEELAPMIDKTRRTRPYRILTGHSHGGLFASYVLAHRADAFQAYIAIDPSLSWNQGAVVEQISALLARSKSLPVDFFLAAAHSGDPRDQILSRMAEMLQARAPTGFRAHFQSMDQETHMSIPPRALLEGLEAIFDGWHLTNPLPLFDQGGIQAVHNHFRIGGERYGYVRTTSAFMVSMIVAELIWKGRLEDAAQVLLHDPKTYPPPWNQLDALARAYADRGNRDRAVYFYRESLKVNPGNEWARTKLEEMGVEPSKKDPCVRIAFAVGGAATPPRSEGVLISLSSSRWGPFPYHPRRPSRSSDARV